MRTIASATTSARFPTQSPIAVVSATIGLTQNRLLLEPLRSRQCASLPVYHTVHIRKFDRRVAAPFIGTIPEGDHLRDRLFSRLKSWIVCGGIGRRRVIDEGYALYSVSAAAFIGPYTLSGSPLSRSKRRIRRVLRHRSPHGKR